MQRRLTKDNNQVSAPASEKSCASVQADGEFSERPESCLSGHFWAEEF